MIQRARIPRFTFVVAIALTLAIALPAQMQNGQFQGTVTDQSGAAVPNATITATNQGTGVASRRVSAVGSPGTNGTNNAADH